MRLGGCLPRVLVVLAESPKEIRLGRHYPQVLAVLAESLMETEYKVLLAPRVQHQPLLFAEQDVLC